MPIIRRFRFGLLIICLALAGVLLSACASTNTPQPTVDCSDPNAPCLLPTSTLAVEAQPTVEIPFGQEPVVVPRVEAEAAKEAYEDGSGVFLDVRSEGAFEAGHIPGALNIPLAEIETRLSELDSQAWIITYCT